MDESPIGVEERDAADDRGLPDDARQQWLHEPWQALKKGSVSVGVREHYALRHAGCAARERELAQILARVDPHFRNGAILLLQQTPKFGHAGWEGAGDRSEEHTSELQSPD